MDHKTLVDTNAKRLARWFAQMADVHATPTILIAHGIDHQAGRRFVYYHEDLHPRWVADQLRSASFADLGKEAK